MKVRWRGSEAALNWGCAVLVAVSGVLLFSSWPTIKLLMQFSNTGAGQQIPEVFFLFYSQKLPSLSFLKEWTKDCAAAGGRKLEQPENLWCEMLRKPHSSSKSWLPASGSDDRKLKIINHKSLKNFIWRQLILSAWAFPNAAHSDRHLPGFELNNCVTSSVCDSSRVFQSPEAKPETKGSQTSSKNILERCF